MTASDYNSALYIIYECLLKFERTFKIIFFGKFRIYYGVTIQRFIHCFLCLFFNSRSPESPATDRRSRSPSRKNKPKDMDSDIDIDEVRCYYYYYYPDTGFQKGVIIIIIMGTLASRRLSFLASKAFSTLYSLLKLGGIPDTKMKHFFYK